MRKPAILITGANGGIASELIQTLTNEGVTCILTSRSRPQNTTAEFYQADFTNKNDIVKLTNKINNKYTSLDGLINTAGIGIYKGIEDISIDEWEKTLAINLTAPFILVKSLLQMLQKSELSLVMNIGSGTGVIPMKRRIAYVTSKFALRGLSLSLAEEYEDKKPHFCLITLGSTLTNFGPMSLAEKKNKCINGKAYFKPKWLAKKLTEIIKNNKRKTEYTLFPSKFGLGEWKKP